MLKSEFSNIDASELADPDPNSPDMVQQLLDSSEWLRTPEIIKLTLKSVSTVLRAHYTTIKEMETALRLKANK